MSPSRVAFAVLVLLGVAACGLVLWNRPWEPREQPPAPTPPADPGPALVPPGTQPAGVPLDLAAVFADETRLYPLPEGARARLGSLRLRVGCEVSGVACSPDGRTLAAVPYNAGSEGVVWDLTTGRERFRFPFDPSRTEVGSQSVNDSCHVQSLAFSPDSKSLAVVGALMTVNVWDVATGRQRLSWRAGGNPLHCLAYSHDGKILASAGIDCTVDLWDAETGKALRTLRGHKWVVKGLSFSPDDKTLVSCSVDNELHWWDVARGEQTGKLVGGEYEDVFQCVTYSPDGKLLATGGNRGSLRLRDAASGQSLARLEGHTGYVYAVAFSPDGKKLLSAGGFENVTGKQDRTLRVWDVATAEQLWGMDTGGSVRTAVFTPGGRDVIGGGEDHLLRLWDAATGTELVPIRGHPRSVRSVGFAPDGKTLASVGDEGKVRIWDGTTGQERRILEGPGSPSYLQPGSDRVVAFGREGKVLVAPGPEGGVRLWDPNTGQALRTFTGHTGTVGAVALSADGKTVAATGSSPAGPTLRVWEVATGRELFHVDHLRASASPVLFTADSKTVVAADEESQLRFWEVATGNEVRPFKKPIQLFGLGAAALAPNGRTIVTVGFEAGAAWDAADGTELYWFPQSNYRSSVAFAPDGATFAVGTPDGTIRIFNTASGKERPCLRGPKDLVYSVAYAPDSQTLAAVGQDGVILLWNVPK